MTSQKIDSKSSRSLKLADPIEKLLEIKPKAIQLFKNKKYVESLVELEKAMQISPSDLELLFYEALCLYHLDNVDRAALIIEQLYQMDTDEVLPSLPKVCAVILLRADKLKKAKAVINRHLQTYPDDVQFLNMLGYTYEKENQLSDAKRVYRRILKKDPNNANACNSLACLYSSDPSKHSEASLLIKRALAKEPQNPAYLDTEGMLLVAQGKYQEGLLKLKEALNISPGNPEILSHIKELSDPGIQKK